MHLQNNDLFPFSATLSISCYDHSYYETTLILLGRRSTDPFVLTRERSLVLTDYVSALLIANQRWGSYCHAHQSYCFLLLFSTVKLIYNYVIETNRYCACDLEPFWGFLEAHKLACSYLQQGRWGEGRQLLKLQSHTVRRSFTNIVSPFVFLR